MATHQSKTEPQSEDDLAAFKSDFENLRKDFSNIADTLKKFTAGYTDSAREKVNEGASQVRDKINEQAGQTTAAGKKLVDDLQDQVNQRPLATLLVAATVGFVLAKLLTGSNR
jgi:ElaB/YqjD/DUF883 family membrane-anchored ribosome-binding protein